MQLFVSVFFAILFRPKKIPPLQPKPILRSGCSPAIIPKAVTDSIYPMATVCSYVIIFGFICEILKRLFYLLSPSKTVFAVIMTILEITNGIQQTTSLYPLFALPLTAFALSFSGISVHLQIYSCTKGRLSLKKFFFAKLFQGVCAFLIMLFFKIY
ncbi:MAG: hypothetical protein IKU52_07780 [Clostridia bacterium]|nr:hypothetical protein [Clostridia bacterium]